MHATDKLATLLVTRFPTTDPLPPVHSDIKGMPGSAAIQSLLTWVMSLSLIGCLVGGIAAGGMIGFGHILARPHMAERGKIGVVAAIIGAVVAGSARHLVNTGFGMATQ